MAFFFTRRLAKLVAFNIFLSITSVWKRHKLFVSIYHHSGSLSRTCCYANKFHKSFRIVLLLSFTVERLPAVTRKFSANHGITRTTTIILSRRSICCNNRGTILGNSIRRKWLKFPLDKHHSFYGVSPTVLDDDIIIFGLLKFLFGAMSRFVRGVKFNTVFLKFP